ncbi:MAG: rdgC [Gammaproteobacteria bacterium]|jgi:recombination associated protein RdgC|nr:rdgC [Gammaproteobacteria bacterium]
MWFKNLQIFSIKSKVLDQEALNEQLMPLVFTSCLPTFLSSEGWVSPLLEDGGPLSYELNACIILCLQIEEKILPASVIKKEVEIKAKELAAVRGRKVSQKEMYTLKEEMKHTLLPKAFTKLSHLYAYIDKKNQTLIVNTTSPKKAQRFITFLKKSWQDLAIESLLDKKISQRLTRWLIHNEHSPSFGIEKSCVLIDPQNEMRLIRCQQQNLSEEGVQMLAKNGCEVKQMGLSWQDKVKFVLVDDFSIRSIKLDDILLDEAKDMEPETKAQKFAADCVIMTETLRQMIEELHEAVTQ